MSDLVNPQDAPGYELFTSWRNGREPKVDWTSRKSIMRWLQWNDPNGSYTDADAAYEGWPPLTLDELRAHMVEQAKG